MNPQTNQRVADLPNSLENDDAIKWKHFPRYWPFVWGIHRSPVNSPHKGQWRGTLMFCFICALNIWLSKQSWRWWFETPSRSLWHPCNVIMQSGRWTYSGTALCDCKCTAYLILYHLSWSYLIPPSYTSSYNWYCMIVLSYLIWSHTRMVTALRSLGFKGDPPSPWAEREKDNIVKSHHNKNNL